MKPHWTEPFIGLPFKEGGRDASVDCWGLLVLVYKTFFGIKVHEYATKSLILEHEHAQVADAELSSDLWVEISEKDAIDGDAIALGRGKTFHHVGVVVKSGARANVLHIHKRASVVEDVSVLRSIGWNHIKFYRHVERSPHHQPV